MQKKIESQILMCYKVLYEVDDKKKEKEKHKTHIEQLCIWKGSSYPNP